MPLSLYYDRKSADPTYFGQRKFRTTSGKSTSKNVVRFGKHSELLKEHPDPMAFVKSELDRINAEERARKEELKDYETLNITANFSEVLEPSDADLSLCNTINIGYFFLSYIYSQLELRPFFKDITKDLKIQYDPYLINKFLTFSRITDPASKLKTMLEAIPTYYEKPDFQLHDIYRFMDVLADHYDSYISYLFKKSANVVQRNTDVLYYDCTNFYCEIEHEYDDYIDEVTGEVIPELRRYGVSKEHRPNPVIEMGLFTDARGIPISMCIHPGNTGEQLTAIPLEKEIVRMFENKQFVYCADAGLGSTNIRVFNSMADRRFVVTQSIKKLPDVLKQAVFNDCDYKLLSTGKPVKILDLLSFDRFNKDNRSLYDDRAYKVIDASTMVDIGLKETKHFQNGNTREVKSKALLEQKIIVTFSRKMYEYQRAIRNQQIERARKIIERSDPEEIKKGPNDVRRFIKLKKKTKEKEEYILNEERIAEEEKYDGYYAIATNLNKDIHEILEIQANRNKIEDCFRMMKTNFEGRPAYHSLPNRLTAHFMICYTALLVYRLLECKLIDQGTPMTINQVTTTIRNMNVVDIDGKYYKSIYTDSRPLQALIKLTGYPLNRKNYRPGTLTKLARK